jgi:hypothetical protein
MNGLYQPHSDPLTNIRSSLSNLADTFPDGDYSANIHAPTSNTHVSLSDLSVPPYHSTAPPYHSTASIPFNQFTAHDPEALDDLLGHDN